MVRALEGKPDEASSLLFSWAWEQKEVDDEDIFIGLPAGCNLPFFFEYPVFQLGRAPARGGPSRPRVLSETLAAYERASGNDGLRLLLVEALALALGRVLNFLGRSQDASSDVARAIAARRDSINLSDSRATPVSRPEPRKLGGTPPRAASPYDSGIVQEIRGIGFHPFVMVRVAGTEPFRFVTARTQNDAGTFVEELGRTEGFGRGKLVRAIERALRVEIYEAAQLLFEWTRESNETNSEWAYLGLPDNVDLPTYYGYPVFEISTMPRRPGASRLALLQELFEAYEGTNGNDALRFLLIEALGFALSRTLGSEGNYTVAMGFVDRALTCSPYSIHLKAAKHALSLKRDHKPVPPRLEKFIGEDNGHLRNFICPNPFQRFDIGPNGDVLVCCGHWLPGPIGNFMTSSMDEVLNSHRAQKVRESVTDGSYKYCNHLECGPMIRDILPTRDEFVPPITRQSVADDGFRVEGIDSLMFAFDQTCNLSCPSCRSHRIVEKASASTEKAQAVEQKLLPILPTVRVLHINPAGELFASKSSRRLLALINDDRCPELVIDIISNGTLFSEAEWAKFPGIHNKVRSIRISVDAASKLTFERLRRLGDWEDFIQNMNFLSQLRQTGIFREFKFSFTYQLENFREMPAFIEFCESLGVDLTIFERLQNIAFTREEYKRKAVHFFDHPLFGEFISIIGADKFLSRKVIHDFDFPGVPRLSREDELERSSFYWPQNNVDVSPSSGRIQDEVL
jgi:MoaA/NifB/PqqE/SkfB family radical SAM enzyme